MQPAMEFGRFTMTMKENTGEVLPVSGSSIIAIGHGFYSPKTDRSARWRNRSKRGTLRQSSTPIRITWINPFMKARNGRPACVPKSVVELQTISTTRLPL